MNDPKGSIWRKWDLHVHTRKDQNYTCLGIHSLPPDDLNRLIADTQLTKAQITSQEKEISYDEYAKLFISYIKLFTDLSAIAITNHNCGDELDEIINCSRNYNEIKIFPGIEVTSSHGIHILCIFDPNKKWRGTWKDSIEHFMTDIGVPPQRFNQTGAPLAASATSQIILETTRLKEGVCIFAHIGTDNGLFKHSDTASGGSAHIDIYKHKHCNIVQIPSPHPKSNARLGKGISLQMNVGCTFSLVYFS